MEAVGDDQRLMALAEDFSRTVNHDLGYESFIKGNGSTRQ